MYYLHLFKLTLDERKTLTKVSTRKPLTTIPRRTQRAPYAQQRENQEKAVCIIGGESEALGFHQETMEESRKRQGRFCIQTLHYIFHEITFVILLYGSTNVIRTKTLIFNASKILQISVQNSKKEIHYFQQEETIS